MSSINIQNNSTAKKQLIYALNWMPPGEQMLGHDDTMIDNHVVHEKKWKINSFQFKD